MAGQWAETCHPKEEQEVGVVAETLRKKVQGVSHPGLPCWLSWQRICLQRGRLWFHTWVGKIPWRRIGYPLQYSWASLVAQMVKSLPAMWETWVHFLGWEDPLEKDMATH